MKTRNELVTQVLKDLSAVATGQNPYAEDVEDVDSILDAALATLAADQIVTVDPDSIDDSVFLGLSICVTEFAPSGLGVPVAADKVAEAKATLRRIGRRRATYIPQVTSYI